MSSNNDDGDDDDNLKQLLTQLGIEPCFHELIASLCSNKRNYLKDIETQDLEGQLDADGGTIPAAVARGLVRKLQTQSQSSAAAAATATTSSSSLGGAPDSSTTTSARDVVDVASRQPQAHSAADTDNMKVVVHPCNISLRRGAGDYRTIVRCAVRGRFVASASDAASMRGKKILTAILDNSSSMRRQWSLVVNAISRVFTDQLLQQDDSVTLIAIVYNTHATEVKLPRTASDLTSLLETKFTPTGLTNFENAFVLAQKCIQREVDNLVEDGVPVRAVDITTLLFTDGQDTSVPPLGHTSQAATDKARKAGDGFQEFLTTLHCRAHYTCIAAFGEHHNPAQCQYLSDRYYYINRPEVLSDWLSEGLADLLESSGFCSIRVTLPPDLSLAEPLPKRIGLQAEGHVAYEIWLRAEGTSTSTDEVVVTVDDGGTTALHGSATLSSAAIVNLNTLEGRLFLLDSGEMQLRQIARELAGGGRRPSVTELSLLRERLAGVKVLSQPVWDVANDPKARLCGRALLLARLEELETRRNRLSYALGHFEEEEHGDTRIIGSVGIDAVLRDASQRVPLGAAATKYAIRAEAATALPPAQDLSEYGQKCTYDEFSGCNAKQAADQGEALFFRLTDISFSKDGSIQSAIDRGDHPIVYNVFMLLSNRGEKLVRGDDGQSFSHVGIPVFASSGHFAHAKMVLRDVLERLSPNGTYNKGTSERLLLDLLGQYLALQLRAGQTSMPTSATERSLGLFHRARSVAAVLASTETQAANSGRTLLEDVLEEASTFLDCPEKRPNVRNLYRIMASGLLAAQDWPAQRLVDLGEAVLEESMRRAFSRTFAGLSDTDRIKLGWALLGPLNTGNEWLDCPIHDQHSQKIHIEGFRFQSAASELENLEAKSPGEYSPRQPELVAQALGSSPPSGTPPITEWKALRSLVSRWSTVMEQEQKSSSGGIWRLLDDLMTSESASNAATLQRLGEVLTPEPAVTTLREVLPDNPLRVLSSLVVHCMRGFSFESGSGDDKVGLHNRPLRLVLASKISSIVKRRVQYAQKYPIRGAAYPTSKQVSEKDMQIWWGSAARPVDEQLYREARRSIHRRHHEATAIVKDALTDKAYRKQGGHFEFPSDFDTFIPGLHRRTRDLHDAWQRKKKETYGADARVEATEEMLLRLRWDDRDARARVKLSKIVAQIWDGLEGIQPGQPISSALWLDDDEEEDGDTSIPNIVTTTTSKAAGDSESVTTGGEDWSVL